MVSVSLYSSFFLLVVATIVRAAPTQHSNTGRLIVFGDSLSDSNGRANEYTKDLVKEVLEKGNNNDQNVVFPICAQGMVDFSFNCKNKNGKYTNGKVWNEFASESLNKELVNFAVGAATTNNAFVPNSYTRRKTGVSIPDINEQYGMFKQSNTIRESDIVAIWAGANDILNHQTELLAGTPADAMGFLNQIAANIKNTASQMIADGVKNIVIMNHVPYDQTPFAKKIINGDSAVQAQLQLAATLASSLFASAINTFIGTVPLGVTVKLIDTTQLYTTYIFPQLKATSCFENITPLNGSDLSYYDGDVAICQTTAFFDSVHLTDAAHKLLGAGFSEMVAKEFI